MTEVAFSCTFKRLIAGEIPDPVEQCGYNDFFPDYSNYTPAVTYREQVVTTHMYNVPRYGSTHDIAKYIRGTKEEQDSYYRGIQAIAYTA